MLEKEKNEIVNVFKRNFEGYLALNNLDVIIHLTYLFWNARDIMQLPFSMVNSEREVMSYLSQSKDENRRLVSKALDNIRDCMSNENIFNILKYLNNFNQYRLIEIICEDYELYSKYTFSTAKTLSELTYNILESIKGGEVLDLCSYNGNFLTNYAKKNKDYTFTGVEINEQSNLIAEIRMQALRVKYEILRKNVLYNDIEKKYNKIFCEYPLATRLLPEDIEKINTSENVMDFVFSSKISAGWAFVNSVANRLSKDGKAVVVTSNAILYKMQDIGYRKSLLDKGLVEAIISLPDSVLTSTAVATTLIVLSNNNRSVKFINATNMAEKVRNRNELDIQKIYEEYMASENTENTRIVKNEDVADNDYSFLVDNYMNTRKIIIKNPKKTQEISESIYRGYQLFSTDIMQSTEKKENSVPYKIINITDITDGEINQNLTTIYPENDKMDRYLLKDKDVILSSKGVLNKVAVARVKDGEKYLPTGNFVVIRLKKDVMNPYYLKMFLESDKGKEMINSIKTGVVLKAISVNQLKEMNVPAPNIEEQEKVIKRYLDKVEEIKKAKDVLRTLEENLKEMDNEEF